MPRTARLLLLDANALIHRAFHALPPLTSPAGEPVGALYGLTLTLLNVLKNFRPTHVAAAFDRREKTFRHALFPAYKAHREKAPAELATQIARAREILTAFGVPALDAPGYEADDIIGTLATRAAADQLEAVIVSGDQDTLPLVSATTRVHLLKRGIKDTVTLGPAEVKERYGLTPPQIADFKALRGDPSDNIPGVRGIGEKTARALLQQFGDLEGVYRNLARLPPTARAKLAAGADDARMSRRLITLATDLPLRVQTADLRWTAYDRARVIALFQKLGFASLLTRIPEGPAPAAEIKVARARVAPSERRGAARPAGARRPPLGGRHRLLTTAAEVTDLAARLESSRGFVVDTETERLGARRYPLHGVSVALRPDEAFYIPAALVSLLRPVLEDQKFPKWGHNLKYDFEVFLRSGIRLRPLAFDTMLASYVLAPGTRAHDLATLAFTLLGREKMSLASLLGKGKAERALSEVPLSAVAAYSCEDADLTLRLKERFASELAREPSLTRVFTELELPLIPVLAHLELSGLRVDPAVLRKLGAGVARDLTALSRAIQRAAGTSFNVNSTPQLREVLFEKLRLPAAGITRTQTGLSTAAEELEKLSPAHPIIPKILAYRELAKLQSTYLEALPELVDPATGRVYTTYHQTGTATGRLSSSDPNLQNIPVRTPLGRRIRRAFIADQGNVLLAADYSQLQLRLAAHLAGDRALQSAFRAGADIHAETAAAVFRVPLARVNAAQRRVAKTLNFGILYGMGPAAFARAAGLRVEDAARFIDAYFRTYRGLADFMAEAKSAAATQGFVETIAGRRRYLPEISSRNREIRGEAERMAINHPIQGSEADVMKQAMIAVFREIEGGRAPWTGTRMILQVHDELVFEVPARAVPAVSQAIGRIMEGVTKLAVPLVADIAVGKSWGTLKPLPRTWRT